MAMQAVATTKGTAALARARQDKKDEFYTQLVDIEQEMKHYREQFRGKVILCNCDDPYESNFFKYFALNFNLLGLKKLIATAYVGSPLAGGLLPLMEIEGLKPEGREPYAIEIVEVPDHQARGTTDLADVAFLLRNDANTCRRLNPDDVYSAGDFRSQECVKFLNEADVVVTNPPFSLFREFVAQLVSHKKNFIILGNVNAVTYKEIFDLIQANELWLGESIHSGDREFRVPDHYPLEAAGTRVDEHGNKFIRVKGVRWFTNLDVPQRHQTIPLYKRYSPEEYPRYVNFDGIEVSKTAEIPRDFDGAMGVPITFLDKYSPDQFEILGSSRTLGQRIASLVPKGTFMQGGPRFYIERPNGIYNYERMYDRIVIRRRTK
jgi:hypothetical protein